MIYVKKLNGELQKYDAPKLKKSLSNSGADEETINKIMAKVDKVLYDGIETKKLFRFVFDEFKKSEPYASSKYDLKNAILRLGKEGYAFEKLVSLILEKQGYSVKLNQIVKGKYIKHEIDVFAIKANEKVMVECKHHAKPWLGTAIQTALYVYARFMDVKKLFTVPMLVTNTRFSPQVVTYSKGVGLKLMGWKIPSGNSLEYNIEKFKLYPITMLSSLDKIKINSLLNFGITLIRELSMKSPDDISRILNISSSKANKILEEAKTLCD